MAGGARSAEVKWLQALLLVISLHWAFVVSRSLLALLDVRAPTLIPVLDLFSISIFFVFTTVLVVSGLSQVKSLPGLDAAVEGSRSPVSLEELERCADRAQQYMAAEKPYLDPALGLEELASALAVPSWMLSRALNSVLGKNFFHFVNAYRVVEARVMLEDPARRDDTMLRILHGAGFNSKSTFNDAFKRETGRTPSEVRRSALDAEFQEDATTAVASG